MDTSSQSESLSDLLFRLTHDRELGRVLAWLIVALLSISVIVAIAQIAVSVWRKRWPLAWRRSLIALVIPGALTAVALVLLMLTRILTADLNLVQIVTVSAPLIMGIHAALILSLDDEPLIEVLLAAPRPFVWIMAERLIAMLATYSVITAIGTLAAALITGHTDTIGTVIAIWLPAAVLLTGIGLTFTLRTRQPALSLVVVGIVWGVMTFGGNVISILWPILWPLLLFPTLNSDGFALNRQLILLIGSGLILRAGYVLSDTEAILLNGAD